MTATAAPTALAYTRGTKTTRVTTAALAATPGTWVLTVDASPERKAHLAAAGIASGAEISNPATKTGTTLRQVERVEAVMHAANGYYRRAQRTYTIHFTDGSYAHSNSPASTWARVEAPAAPEAPAAEVTAPLAVVTLDGEDATVEVAPTAAPAVALPVRSVWVGWRIADAAMASDFASLAAKLSARKPNALRDRTVRLTLAEAAELAIVASQVETAEGTDGPLAYSARTLRARLIAAWA